MRLISEYDSKAHTLLHNLFISNNAAREWFLDNKKIYKKCQFLWFYAVDIDLLKVSVRKLQLTKEEIIHLFPMPC